MIEWAFAEYFKTGTFPPKPADITKLVREKREAMLTDYKPDLNERARAEAWRKTTDFQNFVKESAEKINKAFSGQK